MKKTLSLLLCFLLTFAFIGCKKVRSEENAGYREPVFAATGTYLAENGKTDYKIVVPQISSLSEDYAARELQEIFCRATGATLPIVFDNEVSDGDAKILSVGNTVQRKAQTDIKAEYADLGETGVRVVTKGETVYMAGATDRGTLNSAYRFLFYEVGFTAYAYDCVYVDYNPNVKLLAFDYAYKPSVEWSIAVEKHAALDENAATRMYMYADNTISGTKYGGLGYSGGGTELDGGQIFSLWCHESNQLASEAEYPEYWKNGQRCLTSEDGYRLFLDALIEKIMNSTEALCMIGPADGGGACDCDGCIAAVEEYGSNSAVFMRFINRCAEDVEEYFDEHNINRRLVIMGMAYGSFEKSPTVKDANGNPVPMHESVVAKKDGNVTVGVCYAPIGTCGIHALDDSACRTNALILESWRGWSSLSDQLFLFGYGTNFYHLTFPFYNWNNYSNIFKLYKEMGVRFCYEMSDAWNGVGGPMSELRTFIRSSLCWNADKNMYDLIDEFADKYYTVVSGDMKNYFDAVNGHLDYIYEKSGGLDQNCYYEIGRRELWPIETLHEIQSILSSAMNKVQSSVLDADEKAALYDRVEREYVLWKVNELKLYEAYMSGDELAKLKATVAAGREKYEIVKLSEHDD